MFWKGLWSCGFRKITDVNTLESSNYLEIAEFDSLEYLDLFETRENLLESIEDFKEDFRIPDSPCLLDLELH